MSKNRKKDNINTGGGANVNGNINIEGQGTFVGRDQKTGPERRFRFEIVVPIVVAIITTIGFIIVAIINRNTEIDKAKLQIQTTAAVISTQPPPITDTATNLPSP
jgi:hypothetical protein